MYMVRCQSQSNKTHLNHHETVNNSNASTSLAFITVCICRSHRSEYEVHRPKLLHLQLQQSRPGRRRRWRVGSAQPPGGDGGEAAHRGLQGVGGLPTPLSRRVRKPDPATELSPSRAEPCPGPHLACPSSVALSHVRLDRLSNAKTQKYTSDTAANSGFCRYGFHSFLHVCVFGRAGTYHRLKNVSLCIQFTLTLVPCYL